MEFILFIFFSQADSGLTFDSQRFANEQSCEDARKLVYSEYAEMLAKIPQTSAILRARCVPYDVSQ